METARVCALAGSEKADGKLWSQLCKVQAEEAQTRAFLRFGATHSVVEIGLRVFSGGAGGEETLWYIWGAHSSTGVTPQSPSFTNSCL